MRLLIDTSGVQFTVGREATPKTDQNGIQRVDRNTQLPMWAVQLMTLDEYGAEVINVTIVGQQAPTLSVGTTVSPVDLQAIPWAQNGKNGTAFRATELKPVTSGSKSTSAASAS